MDDWTELKFITMFLKLDNKLTWHETKQQDKQKGVACRWIDPRSVYSSPQTCLSIVLHSIVDRPAKKEKPAKFHQQRARLYYIVYRRRNRPQLFAFKTQLSTRSPTSW